MFLKMGWNHDSVKRWSYKCVFLILNCHRSCANQNVKVTSGATLFFVPLSLKYLYCLYQASVRLTLNYGWEIIYLSFHRERENITRIKTCAHNKLWVIVITVTVQTIFYHLFICSDCNICKQDLTLNSLTDSRPNTVSHPKLQLLPVSMLLEDLPALYHIWNQHG